MNNTYKYNNDANNTTSFPFIKVNIIHVLIILIIIIALYYLFINYKKYYAVGLAPDFIQSTLVESENGRNVKIISVDEIPLSLYGNEYNYSFWLNIDDLTYKYGSNKQIISRSGTQIFIEPKNNNLIVRIQKFNRSLPKPTICDNSNCNVAPADTNINSTSEQFTTSTDNDVINKEICDDCISNSNICDNKVDYKHNEILDMVCNQDYDNDEENFDDASVNMDLTTDSMNMIINDNQEYDECVLTDLPLNTWVHISLNFYNDNVDMYMNGKLASTCHLDIIPNIEQAELTLHGNGGFSGITNKLVYSNIKLSSRQIYKLYKKGPE